MNAYSLYFLMAFIYLNDHIQIVSPTFLKSENFKTLFCHNNVCLNKDSEEVGKMEAEELTVIRAPKDTFENSGQLYKTTKEMIMDQQKTFLENKYMHIENKKKAFIDPNKLEREKILNRIESSSLTLETPSEKIKKKGEYTTLNYNLSFTAEENITETTSNYELESLPTTTSINTFEVSSYNLSSSENICFCDLTINQCDINCCCDKDCSPFHWKVFTKCNDYGSNEDQDYCFKTILKFKNNTKVKEKQFNSRIFCVMNENLKSSEIFGSKNHELITSLTTFNKVLPKKFFSFSPKSFLNVNFQAVKYQKDSYIWVFEYGVLKPFGIYKFALDLSCSYKIYVKYLSNENTICSVQHLKDENKCISKTNEKKNDIFHYLKNLRIIASPHLINESKILNYEKVCNDNICIKLELYICMPFKNCVIFSDKEGNFSSIGCQFIPLKFQYEILHNGSEGIKNFKAYVWLDQASKYPAKHFIQTTEVKFIWVNASQNVFKRSGNPGYLLGKPLLAGKRINFNPNNDTIGKSIIELLVENSLDVLGSRNGICSLDKRVPINFQENGYYSCHLKLKTEENFSRDNCIELQNLIFQFLLGEDIANITKENFFNKFVASFGNSRPEDTEAWVPVLIDLLPFLSSQISFKSGYNYLMCSNIVSDLTINVAHSSVGAFQNPQSKILGVSFQFGTYKDILFHCDAPHCETYMDKSILLTTAVHFFDLTEPAQPAFAERLSLEIKLPHNFFYPFFSSSSVFQSNKIVLFFFSALQALCLILN